MKKFLILLASLGFVVLTFIAGGCSGGGGSIENINNSVVIADDLESVRYLTNDSTYAYFTQSLDEFEGTINKVPLAGGEIEVLVGGLNNPIDIVSDSKNIYWIEKSINGSLKQMPLLGGTPTILASSLNEPVSLVVYEGFVYWSDKDDGDGMIRRVPIDGGYVSDIYDTRITPMGIATDGQYVFFTEAWDSPSGKVLKVSVNGGTAITLVDGLGTPFTVALDSTSIYWMEFGWEQKLGKTKLDGSSTLILSMNNSYSFNPKSLAIDDANVYFIVHGGVADTYGAIQKVSVNGGAVTTVVKTGGYSIPYNIVLDESSVYWTENSVIKKISKTALDEESPIIGDGVFSGNWRGTYSKTTTFEAFYTCTDIENGTLELSLNTLDGLVSGSSSSSNVSAEKDPDESCPPAVAQAFSNAPFQGILTSSNTLDGSGLFLVSDCSQLSAEISGDSMSGTCVGSTQQLGTYSDSYIYTWSVTRF